MIGGNDHFRFRNTSGEIAVLDGIIERSGIDPASVDILRFLRDTVHAILEDTTVYQKFRAGSSGSGAQSSAASVTSTTGESTFGKSHVARSGIYRAAVFA